MKRLLLPVSFVIIAASAIAGVGGVTVLGVLAAFVVSAVVLAALGRCQHPSPGLLPAMTSPDGTREPARWFCDRCGKTWDARIEHETRPIPRYSGYDESKLVTSAKRAEQLEKHQRSLAVRRAGLDAGARRKTAAAPAEVVAIAGRRRVAK